MKKGIKIFLLIVILMIIIFIVNVIIKKINNNSQSNQEVDLVLYDYPKTFDQYLGENKSAAEVKSLITTVRSSNIVLNYSSNQIEEKEQIKCYFNGELLDEVSIQNKISNEYTYKVEAEYNENGVVNKIIIKEN